MADFFGNGNQQKGNYEATYISRIKFTMPDQNLNLGFKFWKGLLVFDISKFRMADNGTPSYEKVNDAYMSPVKAKIFADMLDEFLKDPNHDPVGVSMGSSDIQKCVTAIHGKKCDMLSICDLTPDGKKDNEVIFEFSVDHFYGINYKSFDKNIQCDQKFYNNIELDIIKDLCNDFARAMLGAYSYGVMDYARFQNNHVENNFNKIFDKLGIERVTDSGGYNKNRGSSKNSFFNKQGSASTSRVNDTSSVHREIEDLDDLMDDDTLED